MMSSKIAVGDLSQLGPFLARTAVATVLARRSSTPLRTTSSRPEPVTPLRTRGHLQRDKRRPLEVMDCRADEALPRRVHDVAEDPAYRGFAKEVARCTRELSGCAGTPCKRVFGHRGHPSGRGSRLSAFGIVGWPQGRSGNMHMAGTKSWRFAHDIDQGLHCALYLRDAIRLKVEDHPGNPPRLVGDVPDRSQLLDREATRTAAARWPSWWHAVLAHQALTQLESSSEHADSLAWLRELGARHQLVFDPPEWASLADSPALRHAARALWDEGCSWFERARRPYLPPSDEDVFAWEQVRDGAERAIDEHDVPPGAINGCAEVLLVEGSWWKLPTPGAAACSIAAARDPAAIPVILKEVFDSHLAG
jgi:hypothetical protein